MTEPDQAVIARLSSDFAAMAAYLARASADLRQLERIVGRTVRGRPTRARTIHGPPSRRSGRPPAQPPAPPPSAAGRRPDGWIGKALAVAGVAVTLIGVALLLVLAAQAGFLSPGVRVSPEPRWRRTGGGGVATRRPTGRPRRRDRAGRHRRCGGLRRRHRGDDDLPLGDGAGRAGHRGGLAVAGLLLSRRWNAEQLGLLVLVPLIGLGPVVADGVAVVLVGFMLALGAASVPVQLGRDWIGMHAARTAVTRCHCCSRWW